MHLLFRLKTIQSSLNKQHELLRLIVRKMEIRSEAEDQDEGTSPTQHLPPYAGLRPPFKASTSAKLLAIRALKSRKQKS